jgi:threonine dehydrogenase-like Zn-dependent dehydrogenase
MQALVYHRSVWRYLLGKGLNRVWPRRFFAGLAPLRLRQWPFEPPAEWVVLKPRLCGICGSDLNLLRGAESLLLEPYASLPAVLGHEVVAEVAEAPAGGGFKAGQRVVVEPILACEVRGLPPCRFCAQGDYNLCERFREGRLAPGVILGFNSDAGGGMAEFMAAPPRQLVAVPEHLPDAAAVLTDSLASALQPVLDNFPRDGDTVVVYGAGIIGQHLIRALRALGSAARLVVAARHPFQADLARAGGADAMLLSPNRRALGDAVGAVWMKTSLGGGNLEGGAHLFFDCVGSKKSLQEGLLALRGRGRYVMVATAGKIGPVDFSSLWFRQLTLTGSAMYAQGRAGGRQVRTYELALELLARGDYPAQGLLTHTFPLRHYRQAFQTALDKPRHHSVKVALEL